MAGASAQRLGAIIRKLGRPGLPILVALLTIAPIARLVYILATTGANTPSSDDEQFIPFFLGQILSGHYNWLHFARDTFQNTHVTMVPALAYVALAYLDHLNIYHALYLGLLLAGVKLVVLRDAFALPLRKKYRMVSLLLWPMLSWLIFSVSQMSIFEHAFQSLKTGFNELGLALGIWAIARFRQRWMAVLLMAGGGLVASFSFACGLVLWPLFLGGMVATGFRRKTQYLAVVGMAVVAATPYADLLYFHRVEARQTALASLFNPVLLVNYLGRPFTNGNALHYERMGISEVVGGVGLVLLLVGSWIVWRSRRVASLEQAAPGLILVLFSILAGWQIILYRTQIAPWYSTFAMDFWIGLVGLACVVWAPNFAPAIAGPENGYEDVEGSKSTPPRRRERRVYAEKTGSFHTSYGVTSRCWSIAVLLIIIAFYIPSNRTRSDKSFFLRTRAPVSAACLRNYLTAPTYCEQTLVPWEVGFPGYLAHLGRPLAEHSLSVFAPRQQWTLQGDFILDTVSLSEAPGSREVYWSPGQSGTGADFTDYNHLNLVLGAPNSVAWSVALPADLESAVFHSAVSMIGVGDIGASDLGVTLAVYVEAPGASPRLTFSWRFERGDRSWHPFAIPLTEYAGRPITLRLAAMGKLNGTPGIFRYPSIDVLTRESGDRLDDSAGVQPSNTDLSPGCAVPGPLDYRLDLTDETKWVTQGLTPTLTVDPRSRAWLISQAGPSLEYNGPIDLDLSNYSRFFIRMSASAEMDHRAVRIYYKTAPRQEFNEGMVLVIPLLADGGVHTYTYDLKITNIRRSHLAGIKIVPIHPPSLLPANRIEIADFGLILRSDGR